MKKQLLFIIVAFVFVVNYTSAQVYSGFYTQGFEGATFAPTDWQTVNVIGPTYTWARSTAQKNTGVASAFIRYDGAGGEDWLITPKFLVGPATDKVAFAMRLFFAGYAPDQLSISVSTTDALPASFSTVLLTLAEGTNYPSNANSWNNYEASLAAFAGQEIYIAFKHTNSDGDGLYIDDVAIGTKPTNDVTVLSIDGSTVISGAGVAPKATVKNIGAATQTFNVTATDTNGYSSTMPVIALAGDASVQVTFANWTAPTGPQTLTVTATLAGDSNVSNNNLSKVFTSYANFTNDGWVTKTPMPAARWALASAAMSNGAMDDATLFAIGGGDAAFANSALNQKFSSLADTWTDVTAMPASRQQVSAQIVGNKIYVPGGYSTGFIASNQMNIYDMVSYTWSTGANMPTAVGDYAIATYNDRYIYVIGGYNGTTDVNTVQVYDIISDTWTLATPKSGTATAGLRGGIANGKIVVGGGYSQTLAGDVSEAALGTINPSDPYDITWTSLPALPFGTVGRASAGGAVDHVYFTGGDPTGAGTAALSTTYAYNVTANEWELGPDKPTPVSNVSNFSTVEVDGRRYMVSLGGYNGTAVVSVNEWLDLGCTMAFSLSSQGNVTCNGGTDGTAGVSLTGGTGNYNYSWAPSGGNAATATGLAAGTYTVTVTDGGATGCSATQTFTITEPAATFIDVQPVDSSINSGDNTSFTASTTNAGTFIWQVSIDNGATFTDVVDGGTNPTYSGASTSTLDLMNVLADSNGNMYQLLVSSGTCPPIVSQTVTLTVANVLSASDDDFTAVTIYDTTGGNAGNVLLNDMINGGQASSSGVTITLTNDGGLTGVTIDASGDVSIPALTMQGNYTLTYSICDAANPTNCQSAAVMVTVSPGLAINTFEANAISVYPNPSADQVFIKIPAASSYKNLKVEVYDVTGRTLVSHSLNSDISSINLAGLPSQVYLFKITSDTKTAVKLIIKK